MLAIENDVAHMSTATKLQSEVIVLTECLKYLRQCFGIISPSFKIPVARNIYAWNSIELNTAYKILQNINIQSLFQAHAGMSIPSLCVFNSTLHKMNKYLTVNAQMYSDKYINIHTYIISFYTCTFKNINQ